MNHRSHLRAFFLSGVIFAAAICARGQWNTVTIDYSNGSPYRCHHNYQELFGLVDDVVYPTGTNGYTTFCGQSFGSPQAFYNLSTNETFILGEGGIFDGYGDAISVVKRRTDGWWETNPAPHPTGTEVLHWPAVNPPLDCPPIYGVACPSTYANWIEKAAALGIMPGATDGCTAGKFCPLASVTRGPMANHLVVAFGL